MSTRPQKIIGNVQPGIREEQIGWGTGLRTGVISIDCAPAEGLIASFHPLTNTSVWTAVTLNKQQANVVIDPPFVSLPYPQTPCLTLYNMEETPSGAQVVRFRVRGYDQFGNGITEVTPQITIPLNGAQTSQGQAWNIWLSKVFAAITSIEYKASNVNEGYDSISCGVRVPWSADAAVVGPANGYNTNILGYYNFGWGLPLRVRQVRENSATPYRQIVSGGELDILGMQITNITAGWNGRVHRYYQDGGPTSPPVGTFRGGWTLGDSRAGWQGTPHKVGLRLLQTGNTTGALKQYVSSLGYTTNAVVSWTSVGDIVQFTVGGSLPADVQPNNTPFKVVITGTGSAADGQHDALGMGAANTFVMIIPGGAGTGGATGEVQVLSRMTTTAATFARNDLCRVQVFVRSSLGQGTQRREQGLGAAFREAWE